MTLPALPRRTSNPLIWWQYLCWRIQFWMSGHRPLLPSPVRMWAYNRWGGRRYSISPRTVEGWIRFGGLTPEQAKQDQYRPLPWPFGEYAMGPFVGPWARVQRFFRSQTGGRSHRCEFTDKEHGALYGHNEGAFMDRLFERFLDNIDADGETA